MAVVDQHRKPEVVKQHVAHVREELWFLIDELWEWESQLPYPPEPICPCCRREMPPPR